MKLTRIVLASALTLSPVALFAQQTVSTVPVAPTTPRQTINERKTDQQQRIGQGVSSGQLTARETGHLEHQEAAINREERNMRAQDNGHLTRGDRAVLHQQQNAESRRIYRDKHNGKTR